jgi:hypothetical protein
MEAGVPAGRVRTIPEAVGGWAAGTPYCANDAEALRWVHATLVDTTLVVRERLDGALPDAIKDDYVIEMNRVAALLGVPEPLRPRSHAAHVSYMRQMLGSDRIAVAPCAREMASFLVGRAGHRQPWLGRITEAVTALLLPLPLAAAFALRGAPHGPGSGGHAVMPLPRNASRSPRSEAGAGSPAVPSRVGARAERRSTARAATTGPDIAAQPTASLWVGRLVTDRARTGSSRSGAGRCQELSRRCPQAVDFGDYVRQ